MKYQFISNNQEHYEVDDMCVALGVKHSGYYSWKNRTSSERKLEDGMIKQKIAQLHQRARGRYGHRPIYHHLRDEAICCGRDRTLRLMNEMGVAGSQAKRFKPLGTDSNHLFGYSANLLKELGHPETLNQIWVADTTYLLTEKGWQYLATVMDLFSRRIIGWSVSTSNNSELLCKALKGAVMTRGKLPEGVVHHSDRGSTYASYDYQRLLTSLCMKPSMSAKGNCYDNAAMESFYGRYKSSSVRDHVFADESELRANVFEYIEVFYNRFRKHSSLGYKSPMQFEENSAPPMGGIQKASCFQSN
jgi:putative transposase